jgi:hypothetical protein
LETIPVEKGFYSTLKLINENRSFYKSLGINTENELHSFLKTAIEKDFLKMEKIFFKRMPHFSIGKIDFDKFLLEKYKENAHEFESKKN